MPYYQSINSSIPHELKFGFGKLGLSIKQTQGTRSPNDRKHGATRYDWCNWQERGMKLARWSLGECAHLHPTGRDRYAIVWRSESPTTYRYILDFRHGIQRLRIPKVRISTSMLVAAVHYFPTSGNRSVALSEDMTAEPFSRSPACGKGNSGCPSMFYRQHIGSEPYPARLSTPRWQR